jgi:hypothetical protein
MHLRRLLLCFTATAPAPAAHRRIPCIPDSNNRIPSRLPRRYMRNAKPVVPFVLRLPSPPLHPLSSVGFSVARSPHTSLVCHQRKYASLGTLNKTPEERVLPASPSPSTSICFCTPHRRASHQNDKIGMGSVVFIFIF